LNKLLPKSPPSPPDWSRHRDTKRIESRYFFLHHS
jgi:hypothetical protein